MCGIFAYIGRGQQEAKLKSYFERIRHRGPDHSSWTKPKPDLYLGFHRLAINGLDEKSSQPFDIRNCNLIANAEIFNYKELAAKYSISLETGSDCEIIVHLYKKFGFEKMLRLLDGEFAIVLFDQETNQVFAARDQIGIRGMYIGHSKKENSRAFASEAKSLLFMDQLEQFKPGHFWCSDKPGVFAEFYRHEYPIEDQKDDSYFLEGINYLLEEAVKKG